MKKTQKKKGTDALRSSGPSHFLVLSSVPRIGKGDGLKRQRPRHDKDKDLPEQYQEGKERPGFTLEQKKGELRTGTHERNQLEPVTRTPCKKAGNLI